MTRPDLVIFDCDGVLVDSEPLTNDLLQRDLAARGLPLSPDRIDRLFTGGTMAGVGETAREMGADIPPGWVEGFYETMYARLAEGTPLIDGVAAALDRLDVAGIPYAVGSNGSERKMRITLGQHPAIWARLRDRLYSAHTYGIAKPDPGLFLRAAADAGVPPDRCAVIDDSPSGCTAGLRAGMRTLGFAAHGQGPRLAALGAEVFRSMADLPRLLAL
ncbi:HAD-IA family hydrolase [Psychromarinibacter sp. C21-152]|uniref:HAD-IA family hydrolase n=1 Tax=Psychromarinibacter sediminicola TaxID=3033385 RepID=A0AAE3NZD6_9RHOB|nr:HAD-IA family hydrolase [Psychromarinibacter sediminicola]MDF0603482.1 HAD-IA family hydrolase [Psychromarinibacter sediminicola]